MILTDLQLEIMKYADKDMAKLFGCLFKADGKYYQYIDESHAFDGKYSVSFDVHGQTTEILGQPMGYGRIYSLSRGLVFTKFHISEWLEERDNMESMFNKHEDSMQKTVLERPVSLQKAVLEYLDFISHYLPLSVNEINKKIFGDLFLKEKEHESKS